MGLPDSDNWESKKRMALAGGFQLFPWYIISTTATSTSEL